MGGETDFPADGEQPASDDAARWMRRALALAREAGDAGEVPVGAVLVAADGSLLAEAANQPIRDSDPSAHAEMRALRAAAKRMGNYRLPGTTMYVTLEPCAMCAGALVHARVARLVYAARDPKAGACGSVFDIVRSERLNHRVAVESGLFEDEAAKLLRDFFAERR